MACTIETVNLDASYECGVIDEIQMIGDLERGSAWTNALLGLKVQELHLTGDNRAQKLVQHIMNLTQDHLQTKSYLRISPLNVISPISLN